MINSVADDRSRRVPVAARHALVLLLLVGTLGCSFSGGYVPVLGVGDVAGRQPKFHVVRAGETLYAIAFRYGIDYQGLAKANQIEPPYTIYVNQRIRLASVVSGIQPASAAAKTQSIRPSAVAKPKPVLAQPQTVTVNWRWPLKGEVINGFSLDGRVNKGIDIRGRLGDKVRSAADGVVVYAGGGLRGYGKLVIVKHNDKFLSAYGHNRAILVKEGEQVKSGQVLAEIGSSDGSQEMLHFEIRKNGKPENPLLYLPR